MLPQEDQLLGDQRIRDASTEQIEDLVQRVNMEMRRRGRAGLVWHQAPDDIPAVPQDPADPDTA